MTPGSTPLQFDCSLILNGSTSVLLPKCLVARSHFLFILFSFSGSGSKIPMCLFLGPTCSHCLLIEGQMGVSQAAPSDHSHNWLLSPHLQVPGLAPQSSPISAGRANVARHG